MEPIAYFPWYKRHIENAKSDSSIVVCIRYRSTVSTEPLPSNDSGVLPNRVVA
jgi:hypothetical protein